MPTPLCGQILLEDVHRYFLTPENDDSELQTNYIQSCGHCS